MSFTTFRCEMSFTTFRHEMSFTTFLREMSFTTLRREMSFTSYWYNSSPGRVILVYLVGRPLYVGIPPRPARSRRITAWGDPMAVLSFRCSSAMLRGATLGSHFPFYSPSTDSWGLVFLGPRFWQLWIIFLSILLHPTRGGDPGVTFLRILSLLLHFFTVTQQEAVGSHLRGADGGTLPRSHSSVC